MLLFFECVLLLLLHWSDLQTKQHRTKQNKARQERTTTTKKTEQVVFSRQSKGWLFFRFFTLSVLVNCIHLVVQWYILQSLLYIRHSCEFDVFVIANYSWFIIISFCFNQPTHRCASATHNSDLLEIEIELNIIIVLWNENGFF